MARRKSVEKMTNVELIERAAELRAQRTAIREEMIAIDQERARREHTALADSQEARGKTYVMELTPKGIKSGEAFGKLGDG